MCVFSNGRTKAVSRENLGKTNSAKECAELVKKQKPSAVGATWYTAKGKDCFAELGLPARFREHNPSLSNYSINPCLWTMSSFPCSKACLFTGILLLKKMLVAYI